jgi:hypothetical protein
MGDLRRLSSDGDLRAMLRGLVYEGPESARRNASRFERPPA